MPRDASQLNPSARVRLSGALAAVPTLDEIASDPTRAADLPADAIVALSLRCAAVQSTLSSAALAALARAGAKLPASNDPDEWLDENHAAEFLHQPRRWLFRHAAKLPFVSRVSRKRLICSKRGMERWLTTQKS
jgi:hypothetical protein